MNEFPNVAKYASMPAPLAPSLQCVHIAFNWIIKRSLNLLISFHEDETRCYDIVMESFNKAPTREAFTAFRSENVMKLDAAFFFCLFQCSENNTISEKNINFQACSFSFELNELPTLNVKLWNANSFTALFSCFSS